MHLVNQSWEWVRKPESPLELIELAGRTCYKSEDKITPGSAAKLVRRLVESGHHSVIEHSNTSVKFITDRGVTHELVRHRLAAYSQESTRYCNYGSDHIKFIRPVWMDTPLGLYTHSNLVENPFNNQVEQNWLLAMTVAEDYYKVLLDAGWRPEQARSVLPNSLKTEIIMTANLREWRHVFNLRCSSAAHPQIRDLMLSCLSGFHAHIPVLFDDLAERYLNAQNS